MSINPLNDISRVYLQNIAESSHLETDMKKRQTENEKALKDMKKTPAYKSMASAAAKKFDEAVDQDKDGDNDFADVRIARMIASGVPKEVAIDKTKNKPYNKKSGGVKEGFSNWRQELSEVISDSEETKKIAEKKVNNKVKTSAIGSGIQIPETVENLGGTLLEMVEIDEEFILNAVDVATDYFCQEGLNEEGIDILIEELGVEDFVSFVFELAEEYTLTEARRSGRIEPVTAKGTKFKSGKPTGKSLARLRAQKQARREAEQKASSAKPSGMKAALQRQSAVASAKKQQPAKKPLKDRIAKGVLGAVKAYQQGMERHKAATATAGKALKVAAKGASEFGKGVASGVKTAGKVARDVRKVVGESEEIGEQNELEEKALSRAQQRFMGMVYAAKKGETPASPEVAKAAAGISKSSARDFAKTKHAKLPEKKVSEAVADQAPLSPQELQAQRQKSQLDSKIAMLRKQSLSKVKKSDVIGEEESDRANDERLMRGGVGAGRGSSRPASGSSKPYDPKKHAETSKKAVDLVKQSLIAKYGKGSLM